MRCERFDHERVDGIMPEGGFMRNRRELVKVGLFGGLFAVTGGSVLAGAHQTATPESLEDVPWLAGSSATHNMPATAVAEPGTVQAFSVSPVVYPEFAAFLIHNAMENSVMLRSVTGTVTVPDLEGYSREQGAYNIPPVILPPKEYWIGSLLLPEALAVGTDIEFAADVHLHTEMPNGKITTLLTTIPPDEAFTLPEGDQPWPIRYRNDSGYAPGNHATYRQVFFDEAGRICGVVKSDTRFSEEGVARFLGRPTNAPAMDSGGTVLGEMTGSWLAQWSHSTSNTAFGLFDFGE